MRTHKINIDNAKDFSKVINDKPSIVFAYSPGCGHCENMMPAWENLEKTASTMPHNYQLIKIRSDALPHINKKFSVQGFPTILSLHKGGKVHHEYNGDRSYPDLLRFLRKHLKTVNIYKKKRIGTRRNKKTKARKHRGGTRKTKRCARK
jgi:thioredoxin-like negative regulator of GroEL